MVWCVARVLCLSQGDIDWRLVPLAPTLEMVLHTESHWTPFFLRTLLSTLRPPPLGFCFPPRSPELPACSFFHAALSSNALSCCGCIPPYSMYVFPWVNSVCLFSHINYKTIFAKYLSSHIPPKSETNQISKHSEPTNQTKHPKLLIITF